MRVRRVVQLEPSGGALLCGVFGSERGVTGIWRSAHQSNLVVTLMGHFRARAPARGTRGGASPGNLEGVDRKSVV